MKFEVHWLPSNRKIHLYVGAAGAELSYAAIPEGAPDWALGQHGAQTRVHECDRLGSAVGSVCDLEKQWDDFMGLIPRLEVPSPKASTSVMQTLDEIASRSSNLNGNVK